MGSFSQASSGFLSRPKGTQVLAQSCWAPSTKYGLGRQGLTASSTESQKTCSICLPKIHMLKP